MLIITHSWTRDMFQVRLEEGSNVGVEKVLDNMNGVTLDSH